MKYHYTTKMDGDDQNRLLVLALILVIVLYLTNKIICKTYFKKNNYIFMFPGLPIVSRATKHRRRRMNGAFSPFSFFLQATNHAIIISVPFSPFSFFLQGYKSRHYYIKKILASEQNVLTHVHLINKMVALIIKSVNCPMLTQSHLTIMCNLIPIRLFMTNATITKKEEERTKNKSIENKNR